MCDLAFDAENMARDGRGDEAIELFELLATLDRYDDLLLPAIECADQASRRAWRPHPSAARCGGGGVGPAVRRPAGARTVVGRRQDAGPRTRPAKARIMGGCGELLAVAEAIRPLADKELRFRAEVQQRSQ